MLNKDIIKRIMKQELFENHLYPNYTIYNEFSFQHELGIYLREIFGKEYKILFEKNKTKYGIDKLGKNETFLRKRKELQENFSEEAKQKFCEDWNVSISKNLTKKGELEYSDKSKHEMDIVLEDRKEKEGNYAIELKYIPAKNNGYYASAWSIIKDIKFIDELKTIGNFKDAFCIIVTDIPNIYEGKPGKGGNLYKVFNEESIIKNKLSKENKEKKEVATVTLKKEYKIEWFPLTWLEGMYCGIIYEKDK